MIGLNCKLTNDALLSKKLLAAKYDELLHAKNESNLKTIECLDLKSKVDAQERQIIELRKIVDQMRSERFCSDLIDFDDGGNFFFNDLFQLDQYELFNGTDWAVDGILSDSTG